ncbi:hypothetical protein Peur_014977 [Populus x canadensis]
MSEDSSSSEETNNSPTTSISQDTFTTETTTITAFNVPPETSPSSSSTHLTIQSLSSILTTMPPPLLSSQDQDPAFSLLHDPDISSQVSSLLRLPDSGAVLLALYAHETTSRAGHAMNVNVPDLSYSSIYHETKEPTKDNKAAELNLAVISPSLEPHGTVWSGQDDDASKDCETQDDQESVGKESVTKEGRVPLPWEILQPVLRILGHCLLGPKKDKELIGAACAACRSLHSRSLHDINPQAILATRSLLRLSEKTLDPKNINVDHTGIPMNNVIAL